jgi:uncharacterized protein YggE
MRNYKLLFIAAVTIMAMFSLIFLAQPGLNPAPAQAQTEQATNGALSRSITVIGEGIMRIEPDTAQATIGVQITNPNLEEATGEAQQRMEAILTALQGQGVAEQDIQTTNFNIFVERPIGPEGQPTDELLYHVNNDVQVTIRDLSSIGAVLDAAITAGANNIYGVSFSIDDPSAARAQARAEAINNAAAKAQDLAQLAGVQLGDVVRISEIVNQGVIPLAARAEAMGGAGPIVPGQLEVSVQLEVVYAMQ